MEDSSLLSKIMLILRASCKYYTGFPKDLGPSRVINFTSEREFVQLLHKGHPIVVAFTIKCNLTKHLDQVMEEAAAELYPHVSFMHELSDLFESLPAIALGLAAQTAVSKFNYNLSTYGFREFFKRYGV